MSVYVLNKGDHNYDAAKRYGECIVVTEGIVPIFKTDHVSAVLMEKLSAYKEDDFLLVTGPVILCILATVILLRKFDSIKILVFNAKAQDYVVRQIYK